MKTASKYTIASMLIALGAVWLCLFSFKRQAIPELLAIASLGGGWLIAINSAIGNYSTKSYTNGNNGIMRSIRSSRGRRLIAFLLTGISITICLSVSDKIVSYVLTSLPSKVIAAKITAVDQGPTLRRASYDITFQYVNKSDTITQTFNTPDYSAYWVGRSILIKYSLVYTSVYKVIRLQ